MLLSDIDTWNVGALQSIAFELGDELKTIEGVAGDLELISRLPGWDSPAADAARGKIHSTTGKVLDDAAAIGAVQQLAEETSAAVAKLQSELAAVRADVAAQGGFLQLAANGDVTITGPPDIREELQPIADNIEARAKALIHQAEDIDADCAEVFGHLEHGDITARGATDFATAQEMGRDQSGLSAPYPPEGEEVTPQNVNAWWDALSDEEQQKVIAEHPDWIANRDGVPVPARHQANIPVLERELADVQRQLDALGSREDFIRSHPEMDPAQAAAVYAKRVGELQPRFDNAKAMKEALSLEGDPSKGYDPNKYLMLLEFPDGREPRAAIAVGNPDEAEHVSVTTPGVGTNPTSLPDMVEEARVSEMKRDTSWTSQAVLARRCRLSPGLAMSRRTRRTSPSWKPVSIAGPTSPPDLAEFYRGINATNEHGSDVHLSAFGHSYGSLTTAQVLNVRGATGVVDDAAFYGSPGLGYTNETWTDRVSDSRSNGRT